MDEAPSRLLGPVRSGPGEVAESTSLSDRVDQYIALFIATSATSVDRVEHAGVDRNRAPTPELRLMPARAPDIRSS